MTLVQKNVSIRKTHLNGWMGEWIDRWMDDECMNGSIKGQCHHIMRSYWFDVQLMFFRQSVRQVRIVKRRQFVAQCRTTYKRSLIDGLMGKTLLFLITLEWLWLWSSNRGRSPVDTDTN